MALLYIYSLCVFVCVDSISAVPHINISTEVGSTVILPCNLTKNFTQTPHVRWHANNNLVFERSSKGPFEGEGYEGRVDVPEDELHKGNCSLVLRHVRLSDDAVYRTFEVEHVDRSRVIYKVTLFVNVTKSISAAVGSTVVLLCEWRDLSVKTPHVKWHIGTETVFEREGKETFQGEGYEGRVDVPEDELHKGNCSLVLKNVRVTDAAVYRSSMRVNHPKKSDLVQEVQLSVHSEGRSGNITGSSDNHVKNFRCLWILIILPGLV